MTETTISVPVVAAPKASPLADRLFGTYVPRLIAGLSILLAWELVVRGFAPAYVAKPTTVLLAIPRVIVDPTFLTATGATLAAVAEGLAIALVVGTVIGLLMGRSLGFERAIRHYINGFYAMPMIVVLPLFSLWFGYSGAARIATIIFAAIFSIIINVADGARSVPREYLEVARSFRSRRLEDADRDRAALVGALSVGRRAARRRARAHRRGRGGVFPLGRRARLLHSV